MIEFAEEEIKKEDVLPDKVCQSDCTNWTKMGCGLLTNRCIRRLPILDLYTKRKVYHND